MNTNQKKQYPKTKYTIRVFEEGFEILEMVVETDNRSSNVYIHSQRREFCQAWEPVSTAMGAAAFWIWKQVFRDKVFPQLLRENEKPPAD